METTAVPNETPVVETVPNTTPADVPPQGEQPSSTAPAETVAATEEPLTLPPVEPFQPQKQNLPQEDYYTPEKVIGAYKGKEKELFEAVAKATGIPEYALKVLPHIKSQESLSAYYQATSTDWNNLSKEQLLEMKLKEEYSQIGGLPADKIARLVQSDLRNLYGIGLEYDDPESEEVIKAEYKGLRDSHDYRQSKMQQQQQILQSLAQQQPQGEQPIEVDPRQRLEKARQQVLQDEWVRKTVQSKVIPIGDFNYELKDAPATLQTVYDGDKWAYTLAKKDEQGNAMLDNDGNYVPNYELSMQVAAFAENPKGFIETLINHGKTMARKEFDNERENIPDNTSYGPDLKQPSLAGLFAKAPIIG